MTFSIVGRDPVTGALGMAVTSSSPSVGARCIHLRSEVGAVASQNVTDPRLGSAILDLLEQGANASQALETVLADYPTKDFRQLSVVDSEGATAHHSGKGTLGAHKVVVGDQVVAAGNLLSSEVVPDKMVEAFNATEGELEEKLLAGLSAGEQAGGEEGEVRSAGLAVVHNVGWRVTDLRVDEAPCPIDELGRILTVWLPQRDDYITRGINPEAAPSYGVPGDE
ncbi:DUF1028 domain-containing protein [Enteractinococcus helveticum]|uniref:Fimbrial assembly protein FimA n=1 Tax=Enteractinococcus helveticum TaxID=1837282 RepID=A0A1B7M224_9MICC|nr:DUF1028 domain-containing protein [Enteractinococcus helveticum]OAV62624.1 fimbrial assembly protein FimA [Enteractinococcus helveticum]